MTPTPRVASLCLLALGFIWVIQSGPVASQSKLVRFYEPGDLRPTLAADGRSPILAGLNNSLTASGANLPEDWIVVAVPEGTRLAAVRAVAETVDRRSFPGTEGAGTAPWAELAGSGYLRGQRLEHIRVRPVRGETAGELEVARRLRLELDLEPDSEAPLSVRPVRWPGEDSFSRAVHRIAPGLAPDPTRRNLLVNGGEAFSPRFIPSEDGSPVRYLIITTDLLAPEFERFAAWKTATGMPAVVRTLSWIEANYPQGVDRAADIRAFIQTAVANWGVEYVLLGGDSGLLPPRYAKTYFYGGENIPSDMYFACLDGTWNGDGDERFGEGYLNQGIPGDGADLYPDVWVGRLPLATPAGVSGWVDKSIHYETGVPLGVGFGSEVLSLAEMLFPQNWTQGDTVIFDGADVSETAMSYLPGHITPTRLYENHTAFPGALPETFANVVAEINAGHNLVLHVGHGFTNTMAVGVGGLTLGNADADGFTNANQGVLYAINCTSSAFDFDCIAEHFLRNPNGGFVASVGSVRLDWPSTGWLYQDEFFDLVYNAGVTRMGEAAAEQKLPFVPNSNKDSEHRWTQLSQIYFGDPDLDLYTGSIDSFAVALSQPLAAGVTAYTVTVTDAGGPVPGAVVCLDKPGDAYAVGVTDALGMASLTFAADVPGPATLAVRGHNHRTRLDSLVVQPSAGPHLYLSGLVVDDTATGNGNGALEAGETARLVPVAANSGGAPGTAVSATLQNAGAFLSLADTVTAIPDLDPDSTRAAADFWEVTVPGTTPDLTTLTVQVQLDASGYSRTENLVLYVGAAELRSQRILIDDTTGNGNGNGTIEANEDQVLSAELRNLGAGTAFGVTATLSSTDPAVQITDATSAYGNLDAGQVSLGDGFGFRFTDSNAHLLTLTVSDAGGILWAKTLDVVAPAGPTGLTGTGSASSIELRWTKPASADLMGYRVYRSAAAGGPFAEITPVPSARMSIYVDEGLPPFTRYYYQVSAVDSSGNESVVSSVAEATTTLPAQVGFPHSIGASASSAPALAYVDADSSAEIFSGGNEIYAFHADGSEWVDGDNDARTFGVLTGTGAGPFWSPPAVGDIDLDGAVEVVAAGFTSGLLYVWELDGTVKPGWPKNINPAGLTTPAPWGAAALADVDGDGDLEIFINSTFYTFGFHHDGTEVIDGDSNPSTPGIFLVMGAAFNYSTPAIADVDNDLMPEIVVASRDGKLYVMDPDGTPLAGFPFVAGGEMTNSPAIGDLDNDGLKEIVFASANFLVRAMNVFQVQPPGWPVGANMNQDFDASPALADLDGDGYLDVVLPAGNGTVYAWHGQNGALFPGWGFVLRDAAGAQIPLRSSPAIGNLDADPEYEICFGANNGSLFAFNVDATPVNGFPIGTQNKIEGGPLLWDIDNDGLTEVVAHSLDEQLYVWKSPGAFDPANQPWPMFHRGSTRTGDMAGPAVILSVPRPDPAGIRPVLAAPQPNPFRSRSRIQFTLPPGSDGPAELTVFDVAGRRVQTLLSKTLETGTHEVWWDGRAENGTNVGAGVYFLRLVAAGEAQSRKLVLLP